MSDEEKKFPECYGEYCGEERCKECEYLNECMDWSEYLEQMWSEHLEWMGDEEEECS